MSTRISSGWMTFHKRVFPVMWFGFLVVFLGTAVLTEGSGGVDVEDLPFFLVPVVMAVIGYAVMRKLIWDLVDEVDDHGDYLVVRNHGEEARVELAEIMHVNVSTHVNPPRITLRLVRPGKFGSEISFSPIRPFSLNPFVKNEIGESLIARVDRARSQRPA